MSSPLHDEAMHEVSKGMRKNPLHCYPDPAVAMYPVVFKSFWVRSALRLCASRRSPQLIQKTRPWRLLFWVWKVDAIRVDIEM